MTRILVLGHKGMLGHDIMKAFAGYDIIGMDIGDVDITNYDDLKKKVESASPSVIINCAAYTNVDGCETNVETAYGVNGEGVRNIALVCRDNKIRLVHVSTDYVFDGTKNAPYKEDDATNPVSVYGKSKLVGEEHISKLLEDFAIVRTQWLYGKNGKNFALTMIKLSETHDRLRVVKDQVGSPTYTYDLARAIKEIVDKGLNGIYHVSNSGQTSWHGFASKIFNLIGKDINVDAITTEEYFSAAKVRPAMRPAYSVFDLSRFTNDSGMVMPDWEDALRRYLLLD